MESKLNQLALLILQEEEAYKDMQVAKKRDMPHVLKKGWNLKANQIQGIFDIAETVCIFLLRKEPESINVR